MSNINSRHPRFNKESLFKYDDRKDITPSRILRIPFKNEIYHRQKTAAFICYVCDKLRCSLLVRCSALCAMHRFYMKNPISVYRKEFVSTSCVLLASKYEDRSRMLVDIARVQYEYMKPSFDQKMTQEYLMKLISNEIVKVEVMVLLSLEHDLNFVHPHYYVGLFYRHHRQHKNTIKVALQLATTSMALSFFPVQFEASAVACGCIYLASHYTNDQAMFGLVAQMATRWKICEDKMDYKQIGRLLVKILQATPDFFKQSVGFNLTGLMFKPEKVSVPGKTTPNDSTTPSSVDSVTNNKNMPVLDIASNPKRFCTETQRVDFYQNQK